MAFRSFASAASSRFVVVLLGGALVASPLFACGGDDAGAGADAGEFEDDDGGGGGSAFNRSDSGPPFEASLPASEAGSRDDSGRPPQPDAGTPIDECLDNSDIGNSPAQARNLGSVDDGDDDYKKQSSTLKGSADTDFFVVDMLDKGSGVLYPEVRTTTPGIEICAFATCKADPADSNVKGCRQGQAATHDSMKGCCAAGPGGVEVDAVCGANGAFNDDQRVFIRVRNVQNTCKQYLFDYRG